MPLLARKADQDKVTAIGSQTKADYMREWKEKNPDKVKQYRKDWMSRGGSDYLNKWHRDKRKELRELADKKGSKLEEWKKGIGF